MTGKIFNKLKVLKEEKEIHNGKVNWLCLCECGKETIADTGSLISGGKKSCGCLIKENVKNRKRGSEHPKYNPSLTKEERDRKRLHLFGRNQSQWSSKVIERNKNICQNCFKNTFGTNVAAHHLDGYNSFPEKRYELSNGITLCKECHNAFHKKYGRGGNTKEQYEKFNKSFVK